MKVVFKIAEDMDLNIVKSWVRDEANRHNAYLEAYPDEAGERRTDADIDASINALVKLITGEGLASSEEEAIKNYNGYYGTQGNHSLEYIDDQGCHIIEDLGSSVTYCPTNRILTIRGRRDSLQQSHTTDVARAIYCVEELNSFELVEFRSLDWNRGWFESSEMALPKEEMKERLETRTQMLDVVARCVVHNDWSAWYANQKWYAKIAYHADMGLPDPTEEIHQSAVEWFASADWRVRKEIMLTCPVTA